MNDNPALSELKKAVIQQKTASLPVEPEQPELEGLHTAVEAYDRLVSEVVIGLIQGRATAFPREHILAAQAAVDAALTQVQGQPVRGVEIYRKYKQRLDQMVQLAEKVA